VSPLSGSGIPRAVDMAKCSRKLEP